MKLQTTCESMLTKSLEGFCHARNADYPVVVQYLKPYLGAKTKGLDDDVVEWELNNKGREFAMDGGWVAKEKKAEAQSYKTNSELEYYKHQTKVNKWLYRSRWWPLIISIVALVISVISIFFAPKDIFPSGNEEQKQSVSDIASSIGTTENGDDEKGGSKQSHKGECKEDSCRYFGNPDKESK